MLSQKVTNRPHVDVWSGEGITQRRSVDHGMHVCDVARNTTVTQVGVNIAGISECEKTNSTTRIDIDNFFCICSV